MKTNTKKKDLFEKYAKRISTRHDIKMMTFEQFEEFIANEIELGLEFRDIPIDQQILDALNSSHPYHNILKLFKEYSNKLLRVERSQEEINISNDVIEEINKRQFDFIKDRINFFYFKFHAMGESGRVLSDTCVDKYAKELADGLNKIPNKENTF